MPLDREESKRQSLGDPHPKLPGVDFLRGFDPHVIGQCALRNPRASGGVHLPLATLRAGRLMRLGATFRFGVRGSPKHLYWHPPSRISRPCNTPTRQPQEYLSRLDVGTTGTDVASDSSQSSWFVAERGTTNDNGLVPNESSDLRWPVEIRTR